MTREEFYDQCRRHDWFFEMSDDHGVWSRGTANLKRLRGLADSDPALAPILDAFVKVKSDSLRAGRALPAPTLQEVTR